MATAQETFLITPLSFSDCALWYDGADATSFSFSSGSNISQWRDKSGNNRTVTPNTTAPVYDSSTRSVVFNATGALYNTSYSLDLQKRSVFFVANQIAGAGTNFQGVVTFGTGAVIDYASANAIIYAGRGSNVGVNAALSIYYNNGDYKHDYLTFASPLPYSVYADMFNVNTGTLFVNGSNITTDTTANAVGTSVGILLGARNEQGFNNGTYQQYLQGNIYEVIVYSNVLSATQRQFVEGYLAWKWSLQGSLSAAHPYKSVRPYAAPPFPLVAPPTAAKNVLLWQPTVVPTLNLWLDSFDSTKYTFSAPDTFNTVIDKSANAYTMTVVNSNPTINRDIKGAFNFQGSFQMFTYPTAAIYNTTNYNMFMVATFQSQSQLLMAKQADFVNSMNVLGIGWSTSGQIPAQTGQLIWWPYNANGFSNPTGLSTNTTYLIQIGYDAATLFFRINGVQTSTITTALANILSENAGECKIGNMWSTTFGVNKYGSTPAVQNWNLHEMLFYRTYQSLSSQQAIEGYLAWKWGIAPSLPVHHPYYTNPPFIPGIFPTNTCNIFSPTQISGCRLWVDASDTNSLTLTGNNVMSWLDRSGNSNHLTPNGIYSNGIAQVANLNGLRVINFTNLNKYQGPSGSACYPLDAYIVVSLKSLSVRSDVFSIGDTASDNFNSLTFGEYTAGRWHNGSSAFVRTPNTVASTNETSTGFLLMNWSLSNANYIIRRNGIQLSQTASYTYGLNAGSIFQIGFRQTTPIGAIPDINLNAFIAEIVVFNRQLGTIEQQQVEGYLAWKWGLVSNLDPTHPYKNNQNYVVSNIPMVPRKQPFTWTPTRISGCVTWLDGADRSSYTLTGSVVTEWRDKSGSGYTATATSGNTVETQSGLSCIQITTNMAISNYNYRTNSSIFIVANISSAYSILLFQVASVTTTYLYSGNWELFYVNQALNLQDNTITQGTTIVPLNQPYLLGIGYAGGTAASFYTIHGTSRATRFTGTAATDQTRNGVFNINFGYGTTKYCEILVFNSPLSERDRQQVEGYLAWKWGTQASLPTNHPFTKFPPL